MQFAQVSAKTGSNIESTINDFIEEIVIDRMSIVPWKDIYMLWLLALNDNFDDDLLQDAVQMLMDE